MLNASNETWEWNGTTWNRACTTSPCSDSPPNVSFASDIAGAYDPNLGVSVFVSWSPTRVHTYDGSSWTLHCDPCDESLTTSQVFFHPVLNMVLNVRSKTYGWNNGSWLDLTLSQQLEAEAATYDSGRSVAVLFDRSLNKTFERGAGDWQEREVGSIPVAPRARRMAYHPELGVSVMFGGFDSSLVEYTDETWEWDGSSWELRSFTTKPCARGGHDLVYDGARSEIVLFGGVGCGDSDGTWVYRAP